METPAGNCSTDIYSPGPSVAAILALAAAMAGVAAEPCGAGSANHLAAVVRLQSLFGKLFPQTRIQVLFPPLAAAAPAAKTTSTTTAIDLMIATPPRHLLRIEQQKPATRWRPATYGRARNWRIAGRGASAHSDTIMIFRPVIANAVVASVLFAAVAGAAMFFVG
jgi:hypothetical protein